MPIETRIVQQAVKGRDTQTSAADVLVAIHSTRARLLGVVAVKHLQTIEAHEPVERRECLAIAPLGDDVVAGGDQVTRIQADADSP